MKRTIGLLVLVGAACGTDLADDPAGNSISGTLHYPEGQSLVDTYGLPGIAIFVQAFLASSETGAPTSETASQPSAVYLKLMDADEIAQARSPDGFAYQFNLINLGDAVDEWPFVVVAGFVDYNEFRTSEASTYFETSPFGAYPTVCSLSIASLQIPETSRQQIIDTYFGGSAAAAESLFVAVEARLPSVLAADARVGSPSVVVSEAAPTTNISFDLYDAAQQDTTTVPCKTAISEIITNEVAISLSRIASGQAP